MIDFLILGRVGISDFDQNDEAAAVIVLGRRDKINHKNFTCM
jgi:hypothetical protein